MADLAQLIAQLGQQARVAARQLARTPAKQIDAALLAMADALVAAQMDLLNANATDVAAARANNQTAALLDRQLDDYQRLTTAVEVLDAEVFPPAHALQAFLGAGGGDEEDRLIADALEQPAVDDVHRGGVFAGAGEDEGAEGRGAGHGGDAFLWHRR